MELTLNQALQQAVAAHKEGRLQDAERLYRAILQTQANHPDANHNLGVLAVAVGKPLEALPFFKQALEANSEVEQFWLSYIDALIKVGRFRDAKQVLVDAQQSGVPAEKLNAFYPSVSSLSDSSPSKTQLSQLLEHFQTGLFDEAEKFARSLIKGSPNHHFAWKVLGAVLTQTGRPADSLNALQKSLELAPTDAEVHCHLGITLHQLNRLEEAEASYAKAIALRPDFCEAHNNMGNTLRELGRLEEAEVSYANAITVRPDYAKAHYNLGTVLREQGKLEAARTSLSRAIAIYPHQSDAHNNLGNTLAELGRLAEAEVSYGQAISLKPDNADAHNNLANTLQELGRLEESAASYEQAITLRPEYAEAHRHLTLLKKFSSKDDQFLQMQTLYCDPDMSESDRCHICFALAKASEDLENFADAYQFYAEGNALRKKHLGYSKEQDKRFFECLKASYPRISKQSLMTPTCNSDLNPIFIVGMPRSGTTLVEQIISSHPLVTGAGELPDVSQYGQSLATGQTPVDAESLTAFREQYLKGLQRISNGNAVVIDKMPQNFYFLGLIAATLPEAKIIHVIRDPAAVCWANFTQFFRESLDYSCGLEDIIHYHGLYLDLMSFWNQALPNRIYDLDYEALTEDQEDETRKLIGRLGLEWDAACLSPQDNKRRVATASNTQVRHKVYQGSSERWKHYRPFLNGALDHFDSPR